jgi:hypothetical protein
MLYCATGDFFKMIAYFTLYGTAQFSSQGHLCLSRGAIQVFVKATCVLHNFRGMDMRTKRGSVARRRVPEYLCAALQDVVRMGENYAALEAIRVWEIFSSYFF